MIITYLLAALVAWIVYYVLNFYRQLRNFPPGPRPLPFIGNIHQFDLTRFYATLEQISAQYGSIFTVYFPNPMVVITDYETLKEAFLTKGDDYAGRPTQSIGDFFAYFPNGGIVNANGESWREQRRTSVSILRDFGMGKNVMEQQMHESITEYLRCLDSLPDKDRVEMRFPIQMMIANIIHQTLFGWRYDYDDCKPLMDYVEHTGIFMEQLGKAILLFISFRFPWIGKVPYLGHYAVQKHKDNKEKLNDYIRAEVAGALKGFDVENDEASCVCHAYVQKAKTNPMLTMDQLHAVCSDFFLAGQDTMTSTIRWAVLYLADNQEIQDRMRAEILSVVGPERLPSMGDKPLLPYTTAVCHEVQRLANVLGIASMHRAECDTVLQGHKIAKGTKVYGDIHHILANDPIFKNPKEFQPERYLNADGRTFNKDVLERTVAFSLGKRQCAGEGLARMELFLCLASTIQRYRILPPLDAPINYQHLPKPTLSPRENFLRLERIN